MTTMMSSLRNLHIAMGTRVDWSTGTVIGCFDHVMTPHGVFVAYKQPVVPENFAFGLKLLFMTVGFWLGVQAGQRAHG